MYQTYELEFERILFHYKIKKNTKHVEHIEHNMHIFLYKSRAI